MSSTLAADLTRRDLDTTSLTDDTLVPDTLILPTGTLIVLAWTEDLLAEESSTLWTLCPIVDRLRDEDLTIGERSHVVLICESYGDRLEIVEVLPDGDITTSCIFTDLRVVCDLIVEKILEIFCHWKHNFLK